MRLAHPKAIDVWYDLTSQSFDSLLQSMIQYAHSKSDSFEWQHLDTWLNLLTLKVFVINDKLDTLAGLQPSITTKQFFHLKTYNVLNKNANSDVLWLKNQGLIKDQNLTPVLQLAFQEFSRCIQTQHFWVEGSVGVKDFNRTFMAGDNE